MVLIKSAIKHGIAILSYYSGLLTVIDAVRRSISSQRELVILLYHRVLEDDDNEIKYTQPGMFVSRQVFEKQLAFLAKHYTALSLKDAVTLLRNEGPLPKKSVVITFDDGWQDNYQHAYPILKKYNMPATIFLATDYIDTGRIFWFQKAAFALGRGCLSPLRLADIFEKVKLRSKDLLSGQYPGREEIVSTKGKIDEVIVLLKQLPAEVAQEIADEMATEANIPRDHWRQKRWMLNWDEIREMSQNGVDFGSHGQSHSILTFLSLDQVRQELVQSRKIIEEKTGEKVFFFSYPNGRFSSELKKLVLETGYDCAVATQARRGSRNSLDLYRLWRVGVKQGASVDSKGKFSRALFVAAVNQRDVLR